MLLFELSIILIVVVFVKKIRKKPYSKGIIFFHIDHRFMPMQDADRRNIILYCLYNGYEVGIITASDRTIQSYRESEWMSETLYDYMEKTSFSTFNSHSQTAGLQKQIPEMGDGKGIYGRKIQWQMETCAEILGFTPDDTRIFDDKLYVINRQSPWEERNSYL
jgi:hypothetical protein